MTLASAFTLLTTIATLASTPDLCAELHLDADGNPTVDALGQVFPRYCRPSGPDAPILDAELCCEIDESTDEAICDFPDFSGRCETGERYSCEYGEATEDGAVCYQPFADACDLGLCLDYAGPPLTSAQEEILCCTSQGCEPIAADVVLVCGEIGGYVALCDEAVTNADGTVTCFEFGQSS